MAKEAEIKLNPKQFGFLNAVWNNQADYLKDGKGYQTGFRATFNAGRGSGKTFTLLNLLVESAFGLPGARAGLVGQTYRQVQDIILSQSGSTFEKHGLREYDARTGLGSYVVNRRPPAHWRPALNPLRTFDNCMSFANGYTVQMISADRPDTVRGANLDQLLIDESATIKEQFYNRIVRPTVRANKFVYKDTRKGRKGLNHPLHWLVADFTSAPWLVEGRWIYKAEELQKQHPDRYLFMESTAYDNLANLPGDFIELQREACGDQTTFDVEILNHRLTSVPNGFYYAFSSDRHTYDNMYSYQFDEEKRLYVDQRSDYDPNREIEQTWDFNAEFTSMLLSQDYGAEMRFFDTLFVKTSKYSLVETLCDQFTEKYKDHRKKTILLYGDNGADKRDPGRNETYKQAIIRKLRCKGWTVVDRVQSSYPPYRTRYNVVNGILQEDSVRLPRVRINYLTCKPLVIALQSAPVKGETYEKVKKSESNKKLPQEFATHLTDAFDYIIYKKYSKFVSSASTRTGKIILR